MLFTAFPFLAIFLPVSVIGFFLIARCNLRAALCFLLLCSVVFYGWDSPRHLGLLIGSIAFNFWMGGKIGVNYAEREKAYRWLFVAVVINLMLLAVFKYANFTVTNLNLLFSLGLKKPEIVLPIGISFFTFTQIAYLVDVYRYGPTHYDPVRYGLFVTYFPHLVAGPIIHHAQVMPQFNATAITRPSGKLIAMGLAIFAIGLFKKIVIADGVSPFADAVFNAKTTAVYTASEAWAGTIAYTLQLYFDFSGYSDMAIGLSWIFGIALPYNFNSPYKAGSISDFWRRWHMTLSQFLRDYLYIALGGNRNGSVRRHMNLMLTMLLGGLWHGANWTFIVWGGLHGIFLVINHLWRAAVIGRWPGLKRNRIYGVAAWAVTILAVIHAWVFFRATSLASAVVILQSMWSMQWSAASALLDDSGLSIARWAVVCGIAGIIALVMPNSNEIGERLRSRLDSSETLVAYVSGAATSLIILLAITNVLRGNVSPFIYFNF